MIFIAIAGLVTAKESRLLAFNINADIANTILAGTFELWLYDRFENSSKSWLNNDAGFCDLRGFIFFYHCQTSKDI